MDAVLVPPPDVDVTEMVFEPCTKPEVGATEKLPEASAVPVPTTVVPIVSVTVEPGTAVPLMVATAVVPSVAEAPVSLASAKLAGGGGQAPFWTAVPPVSAVNCLSVRNTHLPFWSERMKPGVPPTVAEP